MNSNIIICPKCKNKFKEDWVCKCGYKLIYDENVLVFPSRLVNKFRNYSRKVGLEQYSKEEPNMPSKYYPRYIKDNAKVILDIGGGDGNALANFAIKNPQSQLYVIDADFNNLKRASLRDIKNLKALNCSAISLPFQDESVDVVFTLFMVEHMYDYEYSDFLIEAKRVLKSDGTLIIATDSDIYDKWLHPFGRFLNPKEKFFSSGFLEKWDVNKVAINHHNLKSPYQTRNFVSKHNFFVQDIRLHLIGGRRKFMQLVYELLIPEFIIQKLFSTMYVLIAKKND